MRKLILIAVCIAAVAIVLTNTTPVVSSNSPLCSPTPTRMVTNTPVPTSTPTTTPNPPWAQLSDLSCTQINVVLGQAPRDLENSIAYIEAITEQDNMTATQTMTTSIPFFQYHGNQAQWLLQGENLFNFNGTITVTYGAIISGNTVIEIHGLPKHYHLQCRPTGFISVDLVCPNNPLYINQEYTFTAYPIGAQALVEFQWWSTDHITQTMFDLQSSIGIRWNNPGEKVVLVKARDDSYSDWGFDECNVLVTSPYKVYLPTIWK